MSNCNCHDIPYINSNDAICRVKWAEYEALLYFLKQGLTTEQAKEALNKLNIHDKMATFLSEQLLRFQQDSRTTLSEKECKKLVQRFRKENKPKRQQIKLTNLTRISISKGKTLKKSKHLNSKGQKVVTHNEEKRPLCLLCNRLAKVRYYKGEKRFGKYCDIGKDHSPNSKRAQYQQQYQKAYRKRQGSKL